MATKIIGNLILSQSTEETTLSNVLTYNLESGLVGYTASSAIGGGGGSAVGSQYEIQYNSDGAGTFGADVGLTYNPTNVSLIVGSRGNTIAGGETVFLVGENLTNRGESSILAGNNSITSPNAIYSIAVGDGVTAGGYSTIATGVSTTANGTGSAVFGVQNTVNGSASLATGEANTITGHRTIVVGSSNTVAAGDSAVFGAINTAVDGLRNVVIGNQNQFANAASDSLIVGQGNGATNAASLTVGFNNINSGSGTLVVGNLNRMTNANSVAIGNSNFSAAANSYLIGLYLSASSQFQTFVGKYNLATNTPDGAPSGLLFGVGGGVDSSSRKTVFAITVDGNLSGSMRIPHNPSDPSGTGNTLTTGSMYYDTTNNRIRIWNGSAWRTITTTT